MIDSEEAKLKLRIAMRMAKAMEGKLRTYKSDWDAGMWEKRDGS